MRIVTNAMLIVSGVYLALGLIYLRFWWAERARTAYLAFTISCFSYLLSFMSVHERSSRKSLEASGTVIMRP